MKYFLIFLVLVGFAISPYLVSDSFGLCTENQDWSDAPCYGCIDCYPGLEQEKLDWSPYYDFKGKGWMDAKKQQLETAIHNNSLREWFVQSDSGAHKNVHKYYFLQGDVPNIYGMNFDEALGFERAWNAVEDDSPDAPLFLWTYHDVILDGTLIETDLAVTITGDHVPLYHIKANKYFKGEKNSDMVTAVENPDDLEFDLFENGLFYLKKLGHQNMYTATIASAKTFGNCDARSLIEISPHLPNEKPPVSMPAHPIGIDPCVPDYFDVDPDGISPQNNALVPEQKTSRPSSIENIDGQLFKVIGPFTLRPQSEDTISFEGVEFSYPYFPVPTPPGGVQSVDISFEDGTTEHIGTVGPVNPFLKFADNVDPKAGVRRNSDGTFNFLVSVENQSVSPLKQIKSGIAIIDVQCNETLLLIKKYDGSPTCVMEQTRQKLIERGWTEKDTKDLSNPLLQRWTYDTKGEISSIDISEDDSIIAVGTTIRDSQKGMLYLLDDNGMILWEKEFESMISHVDISNNTILVQGFHICGGGGGARAHCNYTADIFDIQGNKKQSYTHDGNTFFGSSLSPNGSQIITHTYDVLKYFNIQENDSWKDDPDESIRYARFLTDSTLLVNTDNTGETIALDNTGDKLWSFTTNYPDNYSYATSSNGKYFVVSDHASPDDGNIYLLDSNGNILWQTNTGNTVLHLEFSGDDSGILAELNGAFMVYDMQGNMLWKNNIPSDLTMSSYGSFLLGTTFNQGSGASITLFDGKGNILSNQPTDKESLSAVFALANNDEYFVMANDTNQLVMFEVIPDFDEIYYDLTDLRNSDDLHVKIVPKTPGLFDVVIAKGDSIEIPWDVKFDQGYTRSNFDVSIASDSDIESQITPTSPYTAINGVPPSKKIITIHPKPDATTENYTVQILGRGDTVHNQTGWMTNLDGKTLGIINVNVISKVIPMSERDIEYFQISDPCYFDCKERLETEQNYTCNKIDSTSYGCKAEITTTHPELIYMYVIPPELGEYYLIPSGGKISLGALDEVSLLPDDSIRVEFKNSYGKDSIILKKNQIFISECNDSKNIDVWTFTNTTKLLGKNYIEMHKRLAKIPDNYDCVNPIQILR